MTIGNVLNKAHNLLFDPKYRFTILKRYGFYNRMSDEEFLKKAFRIVTGEELNLDDPKTFNEKLQWLKLHDRQPEYTTMVDKYAVKEWVAARIGIEYIIPTIGVWNHFEDINFDQLPDSFVLKCTHDSGGIAICKDKSSFNKKEAKKILGQSLKRNFFWAGREWPYKNVPPRIIAEPYMVDESGIELKDYKIFNFDGEPKLIEVDFDRFKEHKRNLYTPDWKYIEASIRYPNVSDRQIEKPKKLAKMLEISRILSQEIPHVRTDFYVIDDMIYFGEFTFYHGGGMEKFTPESLGLEIGSWIKLGGGIS